jgi:hypothetical protein
MNCQRQGETCDYSIRLNWEGRGKNKNAANGNGQVVFALSSHNSTVATTEQSLQQNGTSRASPLSTITSASSLDQSSPLRIPPYLQQAMGPSVIDPAIMTGLAQGLPTPYTNLTESQLYDSRSVDSRDQSRSQTPNTPLSAVPSSISRVRQQIGLASPSISNSASPLPDLPRNGIYQHCSSLGLDGSNPSMTVSTNELFPDRPTKRKRNGQQEVMEGNTSMPPPNSALVSPYNLAYPAQPSMNSPLTPGASSTHSDESYRPRFSPSITQEAPSIRRLSVSSLLSGPPGIPQAPSSTSSSFLQSLGPISPGILTGNPMSTYGLDRGFRDFDIGKNDDTNATSGASPSGIPDHLDLVIDDDGNWFPEFGFGFGPAKEASYYATPISIMVSLSTNGYNACTDFERSLVPSNLYQVHFSPTP